MPQARYQYLGKPIAESLRYHPPKGVLVIHGEFCRAELLSPDLAAPRLATAEKGAIRLDLEGIRRFCSVKLR